jgi:hypothetical protein
LKPDLITWCTGYVWQRPVIWLGKWLPMDM